MMMAARPSNEVVRPPACPTLASRLSALVLAYNGSTNRAGRRGGEAVVITVSRHRNRGGRSQPGCSAYEAPHYFHRSSMSIGEEVAQRTNRRSSADFTKIRGSLSGRRGPEQPTGRTHETHRNGASGCDHFDALPNTLGNF